MTHCAMNLVVALCLILSLACASRPADPFTPSDQTFLNEVEAACFKFFWEESDAQSGLMRDKSGVDVCSVAAQGFALAALPVGVERGWVSRAQARERAHNALQTLLASNARHGGMFCHFIDLKTGNVTTQGYESGASSVDTALLVAGALTAGQYFKGRVQEMADQLYAQVDWASFVNPQNGQVYMIWFPSEKGNMNGPGKFDRQTWDWYTSETMLTVMLGIAAPNPAYRLPPQSLTNWKRQSGRGADGEEFIVSWTGGFFTYIFAQCYYDFRRTGKDPLGVDWFENTRRAARANRDWCRAQAGRFATYGQDRWGITSGAGPNKTYVVPGHQPRGAAGDSPEGGTLQPYGAGMALPYLPDDSIAALRHMRTLEVGGQPVWVDPAQGGYGFMDGFNIERGWVADHVIGIADGPMLLMIENARTGLVWDLFMAHPLIKAGITRAGFTGKTE